MPIHMLILPNVLHMLENLKFVKLTFTAVQVYIVLPFFCHRQIFIYNFQYFGQYFEVF